MANTFRSETFNPQKTIGYVAIGFLSGMLLINTLFAIASIGMLIIPDFSIVADDGSQIHMGLMLIGLAYLPYFPVYIGAVITFLIWLHGSFKNLSPLKARNLEFSPGWAVGWWFIPFANLIKPFQVVRELWNESDPAFDEDLGFLASSMGAPTIMVVWWATFLISGFVFRISSAAIDNDGNVEPLLFPLIFLIASIINGIAAVSAIYIIKKINERQEERFKRIGNLVNNERDMPPQPPMFNK